MRILLLLIACLVLLSSSSIHAQEITLPALMPLPAKIQPGNGRFMVNADFKLVLRGHEEPRVKRAADRFINNLSRLTGIPWPAGNDRPGASNFIVNWTNEGEKIQKLG